MLSEQIKQEVFTPFWDNRYGKTTLMEMFFKDRKFLYSKYKKNEISEGTIAFFDRNLQKLLSVNETISIDFFRKLEYQRLIDEYCDWKDKEETNKSESKKHVNKRENILLDANVVPVDETRLYKSSKSVAGKKYKEHKYKKYALKPRMFFDCPLCGGKKRHVAVMLLNGKKLIYCTTCIKEIIDSGIKKGGEETGKLIKLNKQKNKVSNNLTVLTSETISRKLLWKVEKGINEINEEIEYVKYIAITPSQLGNALSITKIDTKYILTKDETSKVKHSFSYHSLYGLEEAIWNQNPEVVQVKVHVKTQEEIEKEKHIRELEIIKLQEDAKKKKERYLQMFKQRKKQEEEARQAKVLVDMAKQEQHAKMMEAKKEKQKKARKEREVKEREELGKLPQIKVRDFVVRRNVFKCMHASHKLENIVAAINIIDRNNEERQIRVNAGYCSNCKIFFIMESTYENLKNKGIPICRVSDEKTYMKNHSVNGMRLAQESILMQYGYNVNQQDGLSSSRRQKILAVLIDKKILRKSEIVSYLDFFISQRQTQSKYQVAISKWEADREFVENYRIGEYHLYGVNAIYRR